jgi:hypothetical protein
MKIKTLRSHLLLVPFLAILGSSRAAIGSPEPLAPAAVAVWDTGRASETPLASADLAARTGWTQVAQDRPATSFQGDLVLTNGRMAAVFRKRSAAVEVYSGGDAPVLRHRSLLMGTHDPAARFARLSLLENGRGRACVEASYQTAKGTTLTAKFSVKKGDPALEADPLPGAEGLRVECPNRFAILPDFFADDIRIDATRVPLSRIEVPSENFILHPTADGNSIVMAVFENRDQDVQLTLSGEKEQRVVSGSEIRFGKGRKIWVGLLETPQVWNVVAKVGNVMKPEKLEWKIPYRAMWRANFAWEEFIGSVTLLLQDQKDGGYIQPSFTGDVHSGGAPKKVEADRVQKGYYSCWADPAGQVTLMPLSRQMQGPVTFYPLNRTADTPAEVFTVVDLARNCLGTGPCDYILDLEGHKDQYKGRATCGVRHILNDIYSKGKQKERHNDVEKCLNDGLVFVNHIRSRVNVYLDFQKEMRRYLQAQKKEHPELAAPIADLDKVLDEMDRHLAARKDKIKTPDDVAAMNDDFRKNVMDKEGAEAVEACKKYSAALVEIGGNQDELVAECRGVVKSLRQRAGILLAQTPALGPVAAEVRSRTQEALRNPAWHEGAQK